MPTQIALPSWYNPRKSKIFRSSQCVKYYRSVFNEWDKDRDGYISIEELQDLVANHENIKLSNDHMALVTSFFDKNNDNKLDFDEFLDLIHHPKFRTMFSTIATKYLRFVDIPKHRRTMKLKKTTSNTGGYENECNCNRFKLFMITISFLQVILYIANRPTHKKDEGPIARALKYDPLRQGEIYRYFTYALVHDTADVSHLCFNILAQICIGIPLEMVHGWRVIVMYWLGVLGGGLTHAVFSDLGLLGASGAVFCFYTAHIATVILNWKEMTHPIISLIIFVTFTTMPMGIHIVQYYFNKVQDPKISHECHFGGAIVGLLLGVAILRNIRQTRKETIVSMTGAVAFIIYIACMVSLNIHNHITTKLTSSNETAKN